MEIEDSYVAERIDEGTKRKREDKSILVEHLLGSVDGTFFHSTMIIKKFLEAVVTGSLQKSDYEDQGNAILASYLIDKYDEYCQSCYNVQRGFFEKFGAHVPSTSYNQIADNNNNYAKDLYDILIENGLQLNQQLVKIFEKKYFTTATTSLTHLPQLLSSVTPATTSLSSGDIKDKLNQSIIARNLVVVAGTGTSSSITHGTLHERVVTWAGLLDKLKTIIERFLNVPIMNWEGLNDPFLKAQLLDQTVRQNNTAIDYRQFVYQLLSAVEPNAENTFGFHTSMSSVLFCFGLNARIATTNYDTLLESCLNRLPKSCIALQNLANFPHYVYHIHGVLYEASNIVLTENHETYAEFLSGMDILCPLGNSLLFVGCKDGAIDHHFTGYFNQRFKEDPGDHHFILLKKSDHDYLLTQPNYALFFNRNQLLPLIYGTTYDEMVPYLWELLLAANAEISTPFKFLQMSLTREFERGATGVQTRFS
jgi:hypothetical protein